jgi:hypothetical protein
MVTDPIHSGRVPKADYIGIITECQNPGIRYICCEEVSGPANTRPAVGPCGDAGSSQAMQKHYAVPTSAKTAGVTWLEQLLVNLLYYRVYALMKNAETDTITHRRWRFPGGIRTTTRSLTSESFPGPPHGSGSIADAVCRVLVERKCVVSLEA